MHIHPTIKSRGVLLDMFKAFDKVWHEGLILKLKSVGICDALLDLIGSCFKHKMTVLTFIIFYSIK